jgi:tetratricopeptide (TPR) repeat protein
MTLTRTRTCRATVVFILMAVAAFTVAVSPEARAQQPSSAEGLNTIMAHRQDLSRRSVEETKQRRFEEGKSDSNFPSDALIGTKGGVVRALTPEEQKALRHNERGLELFSKGKIDGAIKEYQEAIRADQKLAAAHNNLGTAHFAAGRFAEAAAAFGRACELDTEYGQAFFNLALAHIKLGKVKEANEMLDASLRAYHAAGETHMKAGRFKQAEESFRGMLQVDAEYAPALVKLGLIYNSQDRYEEAAQHLRRATARETTNAIAHEFLAEALYGLKKYEEAATSAERALKLSRDLVDAYYVAGLARASLGQRDAALVHLRRLSELDAKELTQQLSDFINRKAPAKQ